MSDERRFATFDVRVERSADTGYAVVGDSSYGGTYRGRMSDPLGSSDVDDFQSALRADPGRDVGTTVVSSRADAAVLAEQIGTRLFAAMFTAELLSGLRETLALAQRDGIGVRIRLRLDRVPELSSLPWELVRDGERERYLCLSNRIQVVRHLGLPEPVRDLSLGGALRVLVVVAAPTDLPPLAVEREWEALGAELEARGIAGSVELRRVDPPTLGELSRVLLQGPWHVFHFIGHGAAEPPALAFCGDDGRSHLVSANLLGITLTDTVDLRLAVLNACDSARADERDAFGGVAQELLQQSVPAAVAMQFAITDPAAIAFAGRFYAAMSQGLPVDRAVGDARKVLYEQGAEWATPVVHLRGDGVVFEAVGTPLPAVPRRRHRWGLATVAVLVAALAVGVAAWWGQRSSDGSGSSDDGLPDCPATDGPTWTPIDLAADPSGIYPRTDGAWTFTVEGAHWRAGEPGSWTVVLDTTMTNNTPTPQAHGAYQYRNLAVDGRESLPSCFTDSDNNVGPDRIGPANIGFDVGCEPFGDIELEVGDDDTPIRIDVTPSGEPGDC